MKFREVIPVGIWLASAVQVAGYTWEAYTGSKPPFGDISGGFGGLSLSAIVDTAADAIGNAVDTATGAVYDSGGPTGKADKAGSRKVKPPGGVVGNVLNFFGFTNGKPDRTVPTKYRPARRWDRAINTAVRSGDTNKARSLITQVWDNQRKRGWSRQDFQAWVDSRPWSQGLAIELAS